MDDEKRDWITPLQLGFATAVDEILVLVIGRVPRRVIRDPVGPFDRRTSFLRRTSMLYSKTNSFVEKHDSPLGSLNFLAVVRWTTKIVVEWN
jgi:hypothetical protein